MLVRTSPSGLLARYVQASPDYPFNVADWSTQTGLTLGVDLGTGCLTLSYTNPLVDTGWRFIRPTAVAARAETLVHAVVRGFNTDKVTSMGPVPYWDGADFVLGAFSASAKSVRVNASVSNMQAFHPYGGVTDVLFTDGAAPARLKGNQYRQTVWADGVNCAAHDFDSGYTGGPVALLGLAVGYPGVGTTHDTTDTPGCYTALDAFFACTGRYLRVTGVPAGWTAKLIRSDLTVLATAAVAGGVCTLDCLSVSLPDPHELALYEGAIKRDSLIPSALVGLWPGETYAFSYEERPLISPGLINAVAAPLG